VPGARTGGTVCECATRGQAERAPQAYHVAGAGVAGRGAFVRTVAGLLALWHEDKKIRLKPEGNTCESKEEESKDCN
jgi:hypothetical protein